MGTALKGDFDMFHGAGADVATASELARACHAGKADKSGIPYIEHCQRVALKLEDDAARTVALLHDVLEDTETTEGELREMFAGEIVDAVVAITYVKPEPRDDYYRRVRMNPLALRVKLADIHDNLAPWRLALLDDETRQRLLQKYGHALVELSV